MHKRWITIVWLMLAVVAGLPTLVSAQKQNQIGGQVVDRENRPVPGVSVKVSRGSEILDKQRTDRSGQYVLKFPSGSPISTLLYECLDCYPCVIFNVSGSKDHAITKVVIKRGDSLSVNEHSEIEATLRYLANNLDIPPPERERYANLGKTLPAPLSTPPISPFPFAPVDKGSLVGVLQNTLTTTKASSGDQFTVVVQAPAGYYGAIIKGHVVSVRRRKTRSELDIKFDTITTSDGQTHSFSGAIQGIHEPDMTAAHKGIEDDPDKGRSRTKTIIKRGAMGALAGTVLGGLLADKKGAAMGAAIGSSADVRTTIAQDAKELELLTGTELIIQQSTHSLRREPQDRIAARSNPDSKGDLTKARELYEARRDDDALAELRQQVSANPSNAESYLLIGRIKLRQGELDYATNSLKTAIFWDATLIDAHLLLGQIFLERGDRRAALSYARSALRLDPHNQQANALAQRILGTAQ